jgi:hypothetical protein
VPGGRLDINAFNRFAPGHIAGQPDDRGGAVRLSMDF